MSARAPSSSVCPITGPTLACSMAAWHMRAHPGSAWHTKPSLAAMKLPSTCCRKAAEFEWRGLIVPVLCQLASQPAGRSSRRLTSLQCRAALQSSRCRCLTAAAGTPALQQQTSLRAVTGGFRKTAFSSGPRLQRTFMLRILYSLLNLRTPHHTFSNKLCLLPHYSINHIGLTGNRPGAPAISCAAAYCIPAVLRTTHPYSVKSDCLPTPSRLSQSMSGVCKTRTTEQSADGPTTAVRLRTHDCSRTVADRP